ncbi:hypothetical protein HPB50_021526 [Hyalomma asiaticum]|uniref:Uncharacterized protein n=1 Tax=Hyalomma asiaticum TaxID=266040 RepID=A0ACB7TR15_HYAAI|nr:hypothetical protein HPB50_021526 [Hyalomma asiaticum]
MTKRYNLRDRERHSSEMNGDGAENLQALGVADSDAGGRGSGTSDTASEQQLALLQLQLKIAEAETEKQRLMLESQRLRAREGAEPNDGGESLSLGGRASTHHSARRILMAEQFSVPWFKDLSWRSWTQ